MKRETRLTGKVLWVLVMNQSSKITSIIKNQVQRFSIWKSSEGLFDTPKVFFFGFTFPSVNRYTGCGNGGSGVVLGREDVAG